LEDGGQWQLTISKCRLDPALDDDTLSGMMASFPWLSAQAVAGTSVEDWQ
jgi:hypothetical protein